MTQIGLEPLARSRSYVTGPEEPGTSIGIPSTIRSDLKQQRKRIVSDIPETSEVALKAQAHPSVGPTLAPALKKSAGKVVAGKRYATVCFHSKNTAIWSCVDTHHLSPALLRHSTPVFIPKPVNVFARSKLHVLTKGPRKHDHRTLMIKPMPCSAMTISLNSKIPRTHAREAQTPIHHPLHNPSNRQPAIWEKFYNLRLSHIEAGTKR